MRSPHDAHASTCVSCSSVSFACGFLAGVLMGFWAASLTSLNDLTLFTLSVLVAGVVAGARRSIRWPFLGSIRPPALVRPVSGAADRSGIGVQKNPTNRTSPAQWRIDPCAEPGSRPKPRKGSSGARAWSWASTGIHSLAPAGSMSGRRQEERVIRQRRPATTLR